MARNNHSSIARAHPARPVGRGTDVSQLVRPPRVHMLLVEGSPWGCGNLQGDFNRTGTLRGRYAAGKDRGRQCEGPDAIATRSAQSYCAVCKFNGMARSATLRILPPRRTGWFNDPVCYGSGERTTQPNATDARAVSKDWWRIRPNWPLGLLPPSCPRATFEVRSIRCQIR